MPEQREGKVNPDDYETPPRRDEAFSHPAAARGPAAADLQ